MTMNRNPETAAPESVDVAIIGAGIGGLAAANAFKKAGIDAHVFERAPELREIGGAVVIREPSAKLFASWNIDVPFFAQAVRVEAVDVRDSQGNAIRSMPTDIANDGATYSVHRADVHDALRDGTSPEKIHLGKECVGVSDGPDRAIVRFADGSEVRAKVVVAADGIKSVVRRLISDDEPIFQKVVVLRGIAPASALPHALPNDRLYAWGNEPRMITLLPMRAGREVAMDTIMSRDEPPEDLWASEVPTSEILDFLHGFDPGLLDMIRAGTVPVRANPVYDRDPIEHWSAGRITLLGDAAHPMAPRQGQGANMAIQDAGELASALADLGIDDPAAAFARYEKARVAPTKEMQIASRKVGLPEAKRTASKV